MGSDILELLQLAHLKEGNNWNRMAHDVLILSLNFMVWSENRRSETFSELDYYIRDFLLLSLKHQNLTNQERQTR